MTPPCAPLSYWSGSKHSDSTGVLQNVYSCAKACVVLAKELMRRNQPFVLEAPHTNGIWDLPGFVELLDDVRTTSSVFDMCSQGSRWRKRTRLLSSGIDKRDLRRFSGKCKSVNGQCCSYSRKMHIRLSGCDSCGVAWRRRAAQKSSLYCENVAFCISTNVKEKETVRPWYWVCLGHGCFFSSALL